MVNGTDLKLIDFGLSKQFGNDPMLSTSCGSPCYAAPEMIKGTKYNCIQTDIWALGVTLYAMAAGHLPFEHQNTERLYDMINYEQYEPVSAYTENQSEEKSSVGSDQEAYSYILSDETKIHLMNMLLSQLLSKQPKDRPSIEEIYQNLWVKESKHYLDLCRSEYEDDFVLIEFMCKFFDKT